MTPKPTLFVSTVGTSLYTNAANKKKDDTLRSLLIKHANATDEASLPSDVIRHIEDCEAELCMQFANLSLGEARQRSAELNGLLADAKSAPADALRGTQHILVTTDTALGKRAGETLEALLTSVGATVLVVHTPPRLRTDQTANFQQGIRKLVAWCAETLEGYRKAYNVIFNLVGGFKTLQGYMTVLGMFYADEILYIFETGDAPIRIPRLPIVVDDSLLKEHAVTLALLGAHDEAIARDKLPTQPPELLVEPIDGDLVTISAWGTLLWQQRRDALLSEELLSFPRLTPSQKFESLFDKSDKPARIALQEKLAEVSFLLLKENGDPSALKRHGGLQYEDYTHQRTRDGRPIGHFRINDSARVNCIYQDGNLLLCEFGAHNIERNPCSGM